MSADKKQTISTKEAPAAIGPYSQAIASGDWVFLSGQIPLDPANGQMVEGGIVEQTEQVLKNMGAVLKAAGLTFADVIKTTVYMKDLSAFSQMNDVYAKTFTTTPPARAAVEVRELPKGALVEIEAIARG